RRHTRSDRDWSSDVCSSDLAEPVLGLLAGQDLACRIALLERILRADDPFAVQLEEPVEEQELLAALFLELAPARERILRPPHPQIGRASCRGGVEDTVRSVR